MKKIKVSIMTNKSYPNYKALNVAMKIDETKTSYYWEYKEIEQAYKNEDGEYPTTLIIEEM